MIKSLINEAEACQPPLRAEEIGVMAPWRDQVLKLRNYLRDAGLRDVDVGTIEVSIVSALLFHFRLYGFDLGLPRTRDPSRYNILREIQCQILGRRSQEGIGTCVGEEEVSRSVQVCF